MAYYDGELLKQNLGKSLNEFEELNVPLSEVAIKIGQTIKSTPTADVAEVVHGEWTEELQLYSGDYEYICSVCGQGVRQYIPQKYCGECGAKMDGRKETT